MAVVFALLAVVFCVLWVRERNARRVYESYYIASAANSDVRGGHLMGAFGKALT